jgi:uncharacterized cupredoxin-like copper-binding protein
VVTAVACTVALAGCGSDGGSADASRPPDLVVIAPGGMVFDQAEYSVTARADRFVLRFENRDGMSHSVAFRNGGGELVGSRILVAPHRSGTLSVKLAAGAYKLICDVPGHERAGMVSNLTVR